MKSAVVVATLVMTSGAARADDRDWFISMGGSFAYTIHEDDKGGSLGGEISVGTFWEDEDDDDDRHSLRFEINPYWAGGYIDWLYDTALERQRISIGPEFGKSNFGLDGGLLVQTGDKERVGISIRPAFTVGVAALTLRFGHYFDGEPDDSLFEIGLLVKWPIPF